MFETIGGVDAVRGAPCKHRRWCRSYGVWYAVDEKWRSSQILPSAKAEAFAAELIIEYNSTGIRPRSEVRRVDPPKRVEVKVIQWREGDLDCWVREPSVSMAKLASVHLALSTGVRLGHLGHDRMATVPGVCAGQSEVWDIGTAGTVQGQLSRYGSSRVPSWYLT